MKLPALILLVWAVPLISNGQQTKEPSVDSRVEAYYLERSKLLEEDSKSFGSSILLDSAEKALNTQLKDLRVRMLQEYKDQHFFPPARYFFQSKDHIENTSLFKLLRKMPKGGILHLHGAASGNAEWLVDRVVDDPDAYVFWSDTSDDYIKGQIQFYQQDQQPDGFVQAKQLDQEEDSFKDSLLDLLTFDESIDADSVDIWKEFEMVFQRIYGFIRYQPVFEDYYYHVFKQLVADGIQHVEIRGIFNPLYHLQRPEGYYTSDSTILYLQNAASRIKEEDSTFTLKTIFTSLRFKSIPEMEKDLIKAYELRKKYPDFIKGFDLVAEEDQGNSTLYFLESWMKMDSLETVYGVDMPLYLHDGESDWVSVTNLYDAVLLDSKRIGHGFNLFRFPNLLEEVKQKNICLEINPLSNQILGFVRDLRLHPASNYGTRGVPCVISSDDPLIFDYEGLSYDFWSVFLAWELDLKDLKALVLNSINYSALNEQEKTESLKSLNRKWSLFVQEAIQELSIKD